MTPRLLSTIVHPLLYLTSLVLLLNGQRAYAESLEVEYSTNPGPGIPFELYGDIIGHIGATSPAHVEVIEIDDEGNTIATCTAQVDSWADLSAQPEEVDVRGAGAAFWVCPTHSPPPRRFVIRPAEFGVEPVPGLATYDGDDVLVDNGHFALRHESTQGGLPNSITFSSGGVLTFDWEDRLYKADLGWYLPKEDDGASVSILANGELAAIVQVDARYLESGSGEEHPSHPRATYRFVYFAGAPFFRIEGVTRQDTPFSWDEVHFAQLRNPNVIAEAHWAAANVSTIDFDDEATGLLTELSQSLRASRWAAIWGESSGAAEGTVGLAALLAGESWHSRTDVILYSNAADTYHYIAGQWRPTSALSTGFSVWMCWHDAPDLLPIVRDAWDSLSKIRPGRVVDSSALQQVEAEREALPPFSPEQVNGRMLRHQLEELHRGAALLEDYSVWSDRMEAWRRANERLVFSGIRDAVVALPWAGEGPLGMLVYFIDRDYLFGFDRAHTLALAAIYYDQSNAHFMSTGALSPWFAANFTDARGDTPDATYGLNALNADEAGWFFEPAEGTMHLTYTGTFSPGTGASEPVPIEVAQAQVSIRGHGDSATLEGAVELTSGTDLRIRDLILPLLDGLGGADSSERDEVAVPNSFGELIVDPGRHCGYQQRYPVVRAAMQLMSYRRFDSGGLLTVFSQDPVGRIKELECMMDRPDTLGFHLSWTHYPDPGPGQVRSFELDYPIRIHLSEGDWYDSARIYRAWATAQEWTEYGELRGRPDRPGWLDDVTMWFRVEGDGANLQSELEEMQEVVFASTDDPPGIAVRAYSWHEIHFDNDYPEYFPALSGVAEAIAALETQGIMVMPYVNGQLWDQDTDSWITFNAQDFATRDSTGEIITQHWQDQDHSVMCPYTSLWQSTTLDLATCVLGTGDCSYLGGSYSGLNAPALYLDQIGETQPILCYAPHSTDPVSQHPPGSPNAWVSGWRTLVGQIRGLEGVLDREIFLSTEGGAETQLDLFDGFLMLSSKHVINKIPLLTAVYNDYIMNFTVGMAGSEMAGVNSAVRSKSAENFLFGSQGSVYYWWINSTADPVQFEFITRLGQAWREGASYLAYGEMLRPPRVEGDYEILEEYWEVGNNHYRQVWSPSVRAAAYRADDGTIALFVTNASLSDQPAVIEWDYGEFTIEERLLDGTQVEFGFGDGLDITMDPADVRIFVLTDEMPGEPDETLEDGPDEEIPLDEPPDAGIDTAVDPQADLDVGADLDLALDAGEEVDVAEDASEEVDTAEDAYDEIEPGQEGEDEEEGELDDAEPASIIPPSEGCSCSTSSRGSGWPWILLGLFPYRRRRRGSCWLLEKGP